MAETQEKIDALEDAIAQGVLEVEYSDKKVKYRSFDDMVRTVNRLKAQLGQINPNAGRRYATFNSGFNNR